MKDNDNLVEQIARPETRLEARSTITLHVLIQCLNGQIAPGLWIAEEKLSEVENRVPSPYPSPLELSEDGFLSDRSCRFYFLIF
jgi:hypothetical protein